VKARFAHVNLVALDWRKLAAFYERVFGCLPVPPERDLRGPWLERATGLAGAHIRGVHLRLPGHGDGGPTLEIFEYEPASAAASPGAEAPAREVNRPGFGHIAFAVEEVGAAREAVLTAGGGEVGPVTTVAIAGAGNITFAYLRDPEGNILELQRWD
jgi:catechol 2,3-dioxygenase-like lactoylglutathione lyase family enzyme